MHIVFKKVILHNFLSYGHSKISLTDKGYCLVSGINNCPLDNALSNGTGKTSWTSAICWALTGQTINGVTQQIKNIHIDEKLCYVLLEFKVNNDEYVITRYKEPKPDLKIIINGEDKSGKGLRESEALLAQYIPDLTANLIASIVILGQGLPGKFTNNTPSGRKEVLEKLSKSDFMIADLKDRINARLEILSQKKRTFEDKILELTSKKSVLENLLVKTREELIQWEKPHDFNTEIHRLQNMLIELNTSVENNTQILLALSQQLTTAHTNLNTLVEEKAAQKQEENQDFEEFRAEYIARKSKLNNAITNLTLEIKKLQSITDICPTCGQKLPNVIKPDTSEQEKKLEELKKELLTLDEKFKAAEIEHKQFLADIDSRYELKIKEIHALITKLQSDADSRQQTKKLDEAKVLETQLTLSKLQSEQSNYIKKLEELNKAILSHESSIKLLENDLVYNNKEKELIENHINVVNQMNTLIKRDFRGILLSNIIDFISRKVKEYSNEVFGTDNLDFKLDGNNIDISYTNKIFESLSGGEKQKVDLIVQFAIRDMMSKYLNFSSNILVLDEITDNLDAIGCTNILNLIANKIDDVESIFIISHRVGDLQIPADSELVIVKNKDGISYIP